MGTFEQKYREALKKAEAFYYSATTEPITEREVLANIFPELKESGDEKIRKNIIIALKSQKDELGDFYKSHNTSESELVAWLGKQGESSDQIHYWTEEEIEPIISDYLRGAEHYGGMIGRLRCLKPKSLEKQGEQKAHLELKAGKWYICHRAYCCRADHLTVKEGERFLCQEDGVVKGFVITDPEKYFREVSAPIEATAATYTTEVETGDGGIKALVTGKVVMPKFKVDDWIVNDYCMGKVIALTDDAYLLDTGQGIPFSCEYNAHLWTIADAKDGDVLQLGVVTAIFKESIGNGNCKCYCSVFNGEFEIPSQDGADNSYGCHNATPATKEQRELLFQKMKEAGYEWDAEKLEPIKVPKPKEPEGALKKLLDEQDKFYKEAKIVLEDKDTALAFLRRTGIIDEYGALAEKYRSDQTPATTIRAVNGTCSTAISDGNTSVTSKEVERHYCTGQYEPDVREFPIEWKEENVDELSEFERAMMHIGGSFFGEKAGLDPNSTDDVKEQAELLLSLVPKQEWSAEDEKMYLSIMSVLLSTIGTDKTGFTVTREIDWMKSLKDKVQSLSQPKEWSEEDERMRQYVVNDLMCVKELVNDPNYAVSVERVEKEIDWMESLKERYAWKPSDKQMHYLYWIANIKIGDSVVEQEVSKHLNELYEDLKKLMEG